MIFENGTVPHCSCVKEIEMPRFQSFLALAVLVGAAFPLDASAAASPAPSPMATDTASSNKDAGTIDGVVTAVDVTPGKSKMVVRSGAQTYSFAVLAGTSITVKGKSGDFPVDVKVGTRVSVSASKSGNDFIAQIVNVMPVFPAHPVH